MMEVVSGLCGSTSGYSPIPNTPLDVSCHRYRLLIVVPHTHHRFPSPTGMSCSTPTAAYVHVPFCRHRCGYCDFTLIARRDDLIPQFLAALRQELRSHPDDPATGQTALETLFLGGGTPTHPAMPELAELWQILAERFTWASSAEVSVEANPLDLTEEKLRLLQQVGVNRLSLGVQSFHDSQLQLLERDHTRAHLLNLLPQVRRLFTNFSVDLIFGLPGQTVADWRESLRFAVESGATHVSTYGLTIESGTEFHVRQRRGQLRTLSEEAERELYATAIEELTTAGFEHYEISNFARPGWACRHNLTYWRGQEYHAYGPGAARYLRGRRETNVRSALGWLKRLQQQESPVADIDELDELTRARELAFIGLRVREGVDLDAIRQQTGIDLAVVAAEAISLNRHRGWLEQNGSRLRLTGEGVFVADRVAADFL